jgi:hypothetical protein
MRFVAASLTQAYRRLRRRILYTQAFYLGLRCLLTFQDRELN